MSTETKDYLLLKWGTLKGWSFTDNPKCQELMKEYVKIGSSYSAMFQKDTDRQKELICQMIDAVDVETIGNDWTGDNMTKEQAKEYVMTYGKKS